MLNWLAMVTSRFEPDPEKLTLAPSSCSLFTDGQLVQLLPSSKTQLSFVGIHHQPVAVHLGINTLDTQEEALYSS